MNILFFAHYPEANGSNRSLLDLVQGLRAHGVTPFFIVPGEGSLADALTVAQIPYRTAGVPWWMVKNRYSLRQQIDRVREINASLQTILPLIREWKIDLAYTNTSVSPIGRLVALNTRLPHIWHIREFGDLHFSMRYIFPKIICRTLLKSSDAIICHAKAIQSHYFPEAPGNVHQIYNGVANRPQFDARLAARNESQPTPCFTFVMQTDIAPRKGQQEAAHALAELHARGLSARMTFSGRGRQEDTDRLMGLIRELDLQQSVAMPGFVADPYPIYFASDCALICSEHEALSRVGLEAMSTGLPLIGKNSGGTPEIITHGRTGLLYNRFDELVEAMASMIQNPEAARQMGLNGWRKARDQFNIEDCAASVYRVIQSVTR